MGTASDTLNTSTSDTWKSGREKSANNYLVHGENEFPLYVSTSYVLSFDQFSNFKKRKNSVKWKEWWHESQNPGVRVLALTSSVALTSQMIPLNISVFENCLVGKINLCFCGILKFCGSMFLFICIRIKSVNLFSPHFSYCSLPIYPEILTVKGE